ncbi:hypothetical protein HDU76_003437 [Blyttiomyces sp. JEL0837]|nr:hypothetical protein HDU76_003437 [Blyttiomyces sp. JEL0837]
MTGGRYLKSEYNMFAVLTYLCLYRLEELTFPEFRKFVRTCDPAKMSRLIGFLFDSSLIVNGVLMQAWNKILDHEYVKLKIVTPLIQHSPDAKELLEELLERAEKGMVPKKSSRKPTEPDPFVLTIPNPRKVPEPPYAISTLTKARAVPKYLYTGTGEKEALEKARNENRQKQKEKYEKAEQTQFNIVKRIPPEKKKKPDEQSGVTDLDESVSDVAIKARPVPASTHANVPIKLTMASILREDALVRKNKMEEEKSLKETEMILRDSSEFQNWREEVKAKEEEEKRLEAERRKLEVQLSHEETYIARQELVRERKGLVKEVKIEKEVLKTKSEATKKEIEELNRQKIDIVHEIQEGVQRAKVKVASEKLKKAVDVATENQMLKEKAAREADEERARKVELIQQIRLLERSIPSVGTYVKTVDLTETSKVGLLSEMSILELQERLVWIKVRHNEAEQDKRKEIIDHKRLRLKQITEKLEEIDREREERKMRRESKMSSTTTSSTASLSGRNSSLDTIKNASISKAAEKSPTATINDPYLKELQEKLASKRAARLAGAKPKAQGNVKTQSLRPQSSSVTSRNRILTATATTPPGYKSLPVFAYGPEQTTRRGAGGPGAKDKSDENSLGNKWGDLEDAEKRYNDKREQLQSQRDQLAIELMEEESLLEKGHDGVLFKDEAAFQVSANA